MNWYKQRQNVLDRVAFIPGGVDRDKNSLLVVSTPTVQECSYEQLVSLLALLADTQPPCTQFTVLLDCRQITVKHLKFYMRACQQALYKKCRQVLIIQPDKFLDQQKMNFDLIVSGYTLKTILISMHKLSKYVDVHQLPEQFGGTLGYDPDAWLENRLEITKWQDYVTEAAADRSKHDLEKDQKLEEFISRLHTTKRGDDEFAAQQLKKSINDVKDREDRDNKEELIEEHAAGVNRLLDWVEGSGEKWLNSLCQVSDNFDEADSLVKQHEQLAEKTKEIDDQTQQLAEMASRLMAVCPQYSIALHKMREQVGEVGEHFARRVDAQTQFAITNRTFQGKMAEFTKQTDSILEKLCSSDADEGASGSVDELAANKKELDDNLASLNNAYESAMQAGRDTIFKANFYSDVLPADQFVAQINSSLQYISQRQNRCNDLANVKRLKQQQLIQLFTTYKDCDQAIKWLEELKDTLHQEYSLVELDETATQNLRMDRRNLDETARSTYEYGKQLAEMARSSERATMRTPNGVNREERLETAWKALDEALRNHEARLRVVESFMVTHRQMMSRVGEIEANLRERLRVNANLNPITMSTERRRLADDIEELASIGRMLAAQINADHSSSTDDRQNMISQITARVEEVKTAQRKMESLVTQEPQQQSPPSESSTTDKPTIVPVITTHTIPRRNRPLSMLPEEEISVAGANGSKTPSPTLARAVRLLETMDGITPAIRLSKNESYL